LSSVIKLEFIQVRAGRRLRDAALLFCQEDPSMVWCAP
jgi:hypothetical protein